MGKERRNPKVCYKSPLSRKINSGGRLGASARDILSKVRIAKRKFDLVITTVLKSLGQR